MMGVTRTILVPNVLKTNVDEVEQFYALIDTVPYGEYYVLDMRMVNFVNPYGVLALVTAARCLSILSGRQVRLENLATQVHLYLHRMNLFDVGKNWVHPGESLEEQWAQNPQTTNLLELTPITGFQSVATILERAERIFSRWLKTPNLGNLLSVLSELCANIYQHSGDSHGFALIQKYDLGTQGQVVLQLAVGDLGCGIRRSLMNRYGALGTDPLDYLNQAMQGRTARPSGRGGLGLRLVEQIVTTGNGYLWLRSETAALFHSRGEAVQEWTNLIFLPGTQIAAKLSVPV